MAFIQPQERVAIAIDTDTGSRVVIGRTPQIEWRTVEFTSPEVSLKTMIQIEPKFSDRPIVPNDPQNPCVKVSAGHLNRAFSNQRMLDVRVNTALAERLVRMIAFLCSRSRIATAPFLWSDYDTLPGRHLYHMPSDEQLLKLSLDPEAELPNRGEP